jgi:sensor histidine kinase YesM
MFIYYVGSSWPQESDKFFLLERMLSKTMVQIILSYLFILVLIPNFLNKKNKILFSILSLAAVYGAYIIHTATSCYYLLPRYPEIYSYRPPLDFLERITNVYSFLGNITGLIFPTIILIVIAYYRKQQELLKLQEQKKTTELYLLRHQLNPHFLFNTLNNLYALAIKKSDKTPEVIEKLSDILDYILYQCEPKFVPIEKEVELLENYIALEKLRYSKRLAINFDYEVDEKLKIAPLLLLTFVENAFKHGVKQELKVAHIHIMLKTMKDIVTFKIRNTKPDTNITEASKNKTSIGLKNIEKQLELLYPNHHTLEITETKDYFTVNLKLTAHVI